MKHLKVPTIITPEPAHNSDTAWLIKGYDPWEFYRETNSPLYESQRVDGMFAEQQMTGPQAIASKLLNDSPANCFNESAWYKLRDEPHSQVVPKMYDASNVSTMLVMTRIEIIKSKHREHRSRKASGSFYIKQPAHHRPNHACVRPLLQRFLSRQKHQ
jgi:hypothetical protein